MTARTLPLALVVCLLSVLLTAAQAARIAAPAWACTSVWSPLGPPYPTVCPDASCNVQQANIVGGSVLVLNVGSIGYTHGGFNPAGSDPASCCGYCKSLDTCNAWVFCNQPSGCGAPGSCTAYINSLGAAVVAASANNNAAQLPLPAFGNFGGCTPNGTFPYQMCSLKRVPPSVKPVASVQGGSGGGGWISGLVPKNTPAAPGCPAGLTAATCKACAATVSPSKCYSCALTTQFFYTGSANCVACSSLPKASQQDTCMACMQGNSTAFGACGSCLLFQNGPGTPVNVTATASCFDCVNAAGPGKRANSGCAQCYNGFPQVSGSDMPACLSCASDAKRSVAASFGCSNCYGLPAAKRVSCFSCLASAASISAAGNCGSP